MIYVDESLPRTNVIADSMRSSVFRNPSNDAIQHDAKAIPEVTVSAEAHGGSIAVRVVDSGYGGDVRVEGNEPDGTVFVPKQLLLSAE